MRLTQVALGDRLTEGHRGLGFGGHSCGHLGSVLSGLADHLGHTGDGGDVADFGCRVAQLHFEPVDVGANGGEFLLAHKSDPANGPLNLGAHQAHNEFPVGSALVDEVLSDQLELLCELLRRLNPRR